MKRLILYIALICCPLCSMAQVQVESKIDSIQILIGEQAHVTLSVSFKKGQPLEFPVFKPSEYITPGVEVLESSEADTSELDNDMIRVSKVYTLTSFDENLYYLPAMKLRVSKVYTLTSFDENLYYLPAMKLKVGGKAYQSKSLALKVLTVPVDTLHPEQFYPPKDVQVNPFMWSEWSPLFWLSVLLVALVCLIVYLRSRLKNNKPIIAKVRIVKRVLPHQKAMQEIERLKAEHMPTSEDQKAYYTRLTDTLRKYMEERFGFNAMEMTSTEIIARLQEVDDKKMIDELRELFTTADLVKFAKYSTLINENDMNLVNAVQFINETKQENQPTTERVEPKLTEQEMRTKRSRVVLKWAIAALAVVCAVMFVYVLYKAFLLIG